MIYFEQIHVVFPLIFSYLLPLSFSIVFSPACTGGGKRGKAGTQFPCFPNLLCICDIAVTEVHAGSLKQKEQNKEHSHELTHEGLPWSMNCESFLTEPVAL